LRERANDVGVQHPPGVAEHVTVLDDAAQHTGFLGSVHWA
jgi:hypothetical protein